MTKYTYFVRKGDDGYHHSVVTRLSDGASKYFFQCGGSVEGLNRFFESMTDELVESYFPRVDKKGKTVGSVDNWLFLGDNPDRAITEEMAREKLIINRLDAQ